MKFRVRNKLELQKRSLGKIRLEWKRLVLDVERARDCEEDVNTESKVATTPTSLVVFGNG